MLPEQPEKHEIFPDVIAFLDSLSPVNRSEKIVRTMIYVDEDDWMRLSEP